VIGWQEKVAELELSAYGYTLAKRSNGGPMFSNESRGNKYYVEEMVTQSVAGRLNTQVCSTRQLSDDHHSALHPSGVTKSITSFGWGKGQNVWQVSMMRCSKQPYHNVFHLRYICQFNRIFHCKLYDSHLHTL